MKLSIAIKILFSFAVSILIFGFTYKLANTRVIQQQKDAWNIPKDADSLKNPFKDYKDAVQIGKKIYIQSCLSCHGNEGFGNGPASVSLNPKPHNLTIHEIQKQSDGVLFWKISNGKGTMVAWKFSLSEKQRWLLVDYIRELGKKSK